MMLHHAASSYTHSLSTKDAAKCGSTVHEILSRSSIHTHTHTHTHTHRPRDKQAGFPRHITINSQGVNACLWRQGQVSPRLAQLIQELSGESQSVCVKKPSALQCAHVHKGRWHATHLLIVEKDLHEGHELVERCLPPQYRSDARHLRTYRLSDQLI
jgi:hypothetical protein